MGPEHSHHRRGRASNLRSELQLSLSASRLRGASGARPFGIQSRPAARRRYKYINLSQILINGSK